MMGFVFLTLFLSNTIIGRLGALYESMTRLNFWAMHAAIAALGGTLALIANPSAFSSVCHWLKAIRPVIVMLLPASVRACDHRGAQIMTRSALFLSASLVFASAEQAAECPPTARDHLLPPFLATITVSGPLLSAMPCGHTDCATYAAATITGRKANDPAIVAAFSQPTTSYLRWTGSQAFAGDGVQWFAIHLPTPLPAAKPMPPDTIMQCRNLGGVTLHGRSATLYDLHAQMGRNVVDAKVWIATADGRPLKAIEQVKGGRLTVTTYDYGTL